MQKLKLYTPREIKIGDRFGDLTVIEPAEDYVYKSTGRHIKRWKCRCDVGHIKIVFQHNLLNGHTSHCTDCSSGKLQDLMGRTFGRLTVIGRGPDYVHATGKDVQWWCVCDHGNPNTPSNEKTTVLVRANDLRSGHISSCGCYRKALAKLADDDRIIAKLNYIASLVPYGVELQPNSVQGVTFLTNDEIKEIERRKLTCRTQEKK